MRVLVADDDRALNDLFCGILRAAGHQPVPAYDGASALMAATRAPQPDLVVLDLQMPAGDGQSTLARLRAMTRTAALPVVVVSATTDPAIRAQVLALGATSFVSKPVNADLLLDVIEAYGPRRE